MLFSVKIDEKDIVFSDNSDSENQPSSFKMVMDFIPVFFAYKYRENRELHSQIAQLSDRLDSLDYLYNSINKLEQFSLSIKKNNCISYFKFIAEQALKLFEKLTQIKNTFPSPSSNQQVERFDFSDEFKNAFRQMVSAEGNSLPKIIKEVLLEQSTYFFEKYLNNRISKYGNQINISFILRNFKYHFFTKIEYLWLKENNVYDEYKAVYQANEIVLPINRHNLKLKTFLFAPNGYSSLIDERKNALANVVKQIPNNINIFTRFQELDNAIHGNRFHLEKSKKYNSGTGCFAIMEDSKRQIYFSLSGLKSVERTQTQIKLCREFKKIIAPNDKGLQRCVVTGNMERYEYKDIVKPYSREPVKILYKNDLRFSKDKDKDYTCCERKILAYHRIPDNNNIFFIRWAPCDKCRPAIHGKYKQIFAFRCKSDKGHHYSSSELIEFDVRKNTDYTLEERSHAVTSSVTKTSTSKP